MFAKRFFQVQNIYEAEGVLFYQKQFIQGKAALCRKHCSSISQYLRKLSSGPQDQKTIKKVTLDTQKNVSFPQKPKFV